MQELRSRADEISFGEIARRVTEIRLARGANPAAATVPRSTIYSMFKLGRTRIDPKLLREVALALEATPAEAEELAGRARDAWREHQLAMRGQDPQKPPAKTVTAEPTAASEPITAASEIKSAEPGTAKDPEPELTKTKEPDTAKSATGFAPAVSDLPTPAGRLTANWQALMILACVVVNLGGLLFAKGFQLTVYTDMIGTAIAAILFGPWQGVAVAVASGSLGPLIGDPHTPYFLPVHILGALAWGYGARRLGSVTTLPRFMSLHMFTALVCTAVSTPIMLLLFGTEMAYASVGAQQSMVDAGVAVWISILVMNLIVNVLDKLVICAITLLIILVASQRIRVPLQVVPFPPRVDTVPPLRGV